jgi:hypothetical protein
VTAFANHLALGPVILDRLQDLKRTWPSLALLSARDLAGVRLAEERLPAVHVLYVGDDLPATDPKSALVEVDQVWGVVASVRDARQVGEAQVEVGEIITAILARLQGWTPPEGRPLRRVRAPGPLYHAGILRVPVYFTGRVLSRGAL